MLEVNDLNVSFDTKDSSLQAVRNVSFDIERGETLCLVGESGSGKSMTALSVMGLLHPRARLSAKGVRFQGQELIGLSQREWAKIRGARIGMIFQEPMTALNPTMKVGQQLAEVYLRHRSGNMPNARKRALEMLDKVGISSPDVRMSQYPHQLSGGIRQRIVIAMALICEPDMIIADEPTTALDVTIQAQILGLMKDLIADKATSMLFITHDFGVVAHIADKVAVMYGGGIVETGTVERVLTEPQHPYTKALLNCLPDNQTGEGAKLGTIPGFVKPVYAGAVGCSFADRCPHAFDKCTSEEPALAQSDAEHASHKTRCWLEAGQ